MEWSEDKHTTRRCMTPFSNLIMLRDRHEFDLRGLLKAVLIIMVCGYDGSVLSHDAMTQAFLEDGIKVRLGARLDECCDNMLRASQVGKRQ